VTESKDVGLLGKSGEMNIARELKDMRLLEKSGEMAILRERRCEVTGEVGKCV
jgi:hypothetical protein